MATRDEALAFLGKQVEVVLERDDHGDRTIARGQLLKLDEGGEFVLLEDDGFCAWCWPALTIRART